MLSLHLNIRLRKLGLFKGFENVQRHWFRPPKNANPQKNEWKLLRTVQNGGSLDYSQLTCLLLADVKAECFAKNTTEGQTLMQFIDKDEKPWTIVAVSEFKIWYTPIQLQCELARFSHSDTKLRLFLQSAWQNRYVTRQWRMQICSFCIVICIGCI